jgi:uncharacterized protein
LPNRLIWKQVVIESIGGSAPCRRVAYVLALAGFLLTSCLAAARADVAAGLQAFDKGDYARAMSEWQSAADKGDAEGQLGLGRLYEFGLGDLAQNYKRADFWYRKAADQNNAEAEYRLMLIWSVGGDDFPPDLAEAYKWLTLAVESKGVWGTRASEVKPQFDRLVGSADQAKGKKLAADWKEDHSKPSAPNLAAQTPTSPGTAPGSGSCANWPFPGLPCVPIPSFPGAQPPAAPPVPPNGAAGQPPTQATVQPAPQPPPQPSAPTPNGEAPIDQLNKALAQIDCAALRARLSAQGAPSISGTVPNEQQKAKVGPLVARLFPNSHPEIIVEIVPSPLCRSLAALNAIRLSGLLSDGNLSLRLPNGTAQLHEGDLIQIEVRAPLYPVALRIDYFSIGGQVLHLWPNNDETTVSLLGGQTRIFGQPGAHKVWAVGGAPFGAEFISVIATPAALDFGVLRRPVEPAEDYLRDLKTALGKSKTAAAMPSLGAQLMVHTSAH